MTYEIKLLDLMDVDVESSFLVLAHEMGVVTRAKTWSSLLLGGDDPILVDTGASSPEIMGRLGMTGYTSEEQRLDLSLTRSGRIGHNNLTSRDPVLVNRVDRRFHGAPAGRIVVPLPVRESG